MKKDIWTAMALMLGALVIVTSGCSSRARIKESTLIEIKSGQTLAAVHYAPPLFSLVLPGPAVRPRLGLFLGSSGRSGMSAGLAIGGNRSARPAPELASQYSLRDPALRVQEKFIEGLRSNHGFGNIRDEEGALAEDRVSDLRERFGSTPVLDFRTTFWALAAYTSKQAQYHTPYTVRARLVMPTGKGVIWEASCSYSREKHEGSPTFEHVTAAGGGLLREMLSEAADHCAGELLGRFVDLR